MNLVLLACFLLPLCPVQEESPFSEALAAADEALKSEDFEEARHQIDRAAERDPKSILVWDLWMRWAGAVGDRDELVYALHQKLRLSIAQKKPRKVQAALREQLEMLDPIAPDLFELKALFVKRLLVLADFYEKNGRPHSAIRIHGEILALDPEFTQSTEAIERIAAAPDPSLAESATPPDLFADVSDEWIREFDAEHGTWQERAKKERENYITHTDAGYEVLVLASEAMEQINAFYRIFFRYGTPEDGRNVSRIDLRIFKNRDEYLKYGSSPAEWSGGQFTGSAVETFLGSGGFESMVSVLFHEAAHQFVALATNAVGWLNEGLASYFEGCRILANGTVRVNLPANHRLFPLAERMERGWMSSSTDGINSEDPASSTPQKAPTFRIVIENQYRWGPPWYAPTWGVVYFLYNYQDMVDGRFVYRPAFREFVDKSGGRAGEGAVRNFEEVVLANPSKATKGVLPPKGVEPAKLPRTVEELDILWKEWTLALRDEQMGRLKVARPWGKWAEYAIKRGESYDAQEFYEKGIVERPDDVEMLLDFARLLAGQFKNTDRAAKLALRAMKVLEFADEPDEKAIRNVDRLLAKWDPRYKTLERLHEEMGATARMLAQRYLAEGLTLMAMDVSWRLGCELGLPDIFEYFEAAVRRSGKSLWIWKLAYNEKNLDGWLAAGNEVFEADGPELVARYEVADEARFDYRFLTLDRVTPGDYSLEAEVRAEAEECNFCGLVFGKKNDQTFHSLVFFPGRSGAPGGAGNGEGAVEGGGGGAGVRGDDDRRASKTGPPSGSRCGRSGYVDLTSFYGSGSYHIWRHNPVKSTWGGWHTMRLDVTGRLVDVWFDGELVVTQEFPTSDVVRGQLGLIMGLGEARFRNIRFLARAANDPGARIERYLKMEKLREEGLARGGAPAESYLGQVPPWLTYVRWVQSERASWDEKGPVPTLLLFWTRKQNNLIPMNDWLEFLAAKYADVGLEFVSVGSHDDGDGIDEYLKSHPFPGAVALDRLYQRGYGKTFGLFSIPKFNVPRLLLLDVDQTVIWEGDPGFKFGAAWRKGFESYVEPALNDLIDQRNLRALFEWRSQWSGTGRPALARGDLEAALGFLRAARDFEGEGIPEVDDALEKLELIATAVDSAEAVSVTLARQGREPALGVLLQWGSALGRTVDSRMKKAVAPVLKSRNAKDWERALDLAAKCLKSLKAGNGNGKSRNGRGAASVESFLSKLDTLQGPFCKELKEAVLDAMSTGDLEAVEDTLSAATSLPTRWLAKFLFPE